MYNGALAEQFASATVRKSPTIRIGKAFHTFFEEDVSAHPLGQPELINKDRVCQLCLHKSTIFFSSCCFTRDCNIK
jgi:hypothetical protein